MEIRIEFYRTRDLDDAHAVLGRVTREAVDLDEAVEIARSLLRTLEMPQRPDAITICDADGKQLYCGMPDYRTDGNPSCRPRPAHPEGG
jgi:hypothetical protein